MSSASSRTRTASSVPSALLEQNDEYQLQHRYMQIEGMAALTPIIEEVQPLQITPKAA
jgi:hypothetical protein